MSRPTLSNHPQGALQTNTAPCNLVCNNTEGPLLTRIYQFPARGKGCMATKAKGSDKHQKRGIYRPKAKGDPNKPRKRPRPLQGYIDSEDQPDRRRRLQRELDRLGLTQTEWLKWVVDYILDNGIEPEVDYDE